MEFSRHEYWSGLLCLPPGDLPNPGAKPRSPSLQVDSLLSEPPGMGKLELLHWTYTLTGSFTVNQCLVNAHYTNFHIVYPFPIHGHLFNAKEVSGPWNYSAIGEFSEQIAKPGDPKLV